MSTLRPLRTIDPRGLKHDSLPMRLYHKAKRLGIWDPRALGFERDIEDWRELPEVERTILVHLTSLFAAGEESVTLDILPLIATVASEGRLEEELFLTTFLYEEAKHTEFFRRVLDEVCVDGGDLTRFHGPSYRKIFYEELPAAMAALDDDRSPATQARAAVTYNMVVEGVLAETGYHAYFEALAQRHVMPGLREGVANLKRDESRHIAYGVYFLSRLVAEDAAIWDVIQERMDELLQPALGVVYETLGAYEGTPFGLTPDIFVEFATTQFARRFARIERARGATLEQVEELAAEDE